VLQCVVQCVLQCASIEEEGDPPLGYVMSVAVCVAVRVAVCIAVRIAVCIAGWSHSRKG